MLSSIMDKNLYRYLPPGRTAATTVVMASMVPTVRWCCIVRRRKGTKTSQISQSNLTAPSPTSQSNLGRKKSPPWWYRNHHNHHHCNLQLLLLPLPQPQQELQLLPLLTSRQNVVLVEPFSVARIFLTRSRCFSAPRPVKYPSQI